MAKDYLSGLKSKSLTILKDQGVFRDPFEMQIYENFVPWMYRQIKDFVDEDQHYLKLYHSYYLTSLF